MWSVAVEMQMYVVSPLIIFAMFKSSKSKIWIITFSICLLSTLLNFYWLLFSDFEETYAYKIYIKT